MSQTNVDILMPSMGEGVLEATVVRWTKNIGDLIAKDEPLLEVSTDKVDTEIVSTDAGFLIATFVSADELIKVDQVIAQIGATKETPVTTPKVVTEQLAQQATTTQSNVKATSTQTQTNTAAMGSMPTSFCGIIRSSPLVRRMAQEHGIPLGKVPGSGLYGRITKQDLEAFLFQVGAQSPTATVLPHVTTSASTAENDNLKTTVTNGSEALDGVTIRREPMSKIRKLTAAHMTKSIRTSPHVTTTFEIDLEAINQHKKSHGLAWLNDEKAKLTYTSYFVWASIQALKVFPDINAVVDGEDILYRDQINIGCAVATPTGLIVPVIKSAQDLSFLELCRALDDIVQRARKKTLKPNDIKGGTFSITNPGVFGSLHSQPIINQPQSAILSIGAMIKRPCVIADEIVIHPLSQVGLTFDHRIIDGEGGAKFLAHLKNTLETFA